MENRPVLIRSSSQLSIQIAFPMRSSGRGLSKRSFSKSFLKNFAIRKLNTMPIRQDALSLEGRRPIVVSREEKLLSTLMGEWAVMGEAVFQGRPQQRWTEVLPIWPGILQRMW